MKCKNWKVWVRMVEFSSFHVSNTSQFETLLDWMCCKITQKHIQIKRRPAESARHPWRNWTVIVWIRRNRWTTSCGKMRTLHLSASPTTARRICYRWNTTTRGSPPSAFSFFSCAFPLCLPSPLGLLQSSAQCPLFPNGFLVLLFFSRTGHALLGLFTQKYPPDRVRLHLNMWSDLLSSLDVSMDCIDTFLWIGDGISDIIKSVKAILNQLVSRFSILINFWPPASNAKNYRHVHRNPDMCNIEWERSLSSFTSTPQYIELDGLDGEPVEFEWIIVPGHTTLQILQEIQNLMKDVSRLESTWIT